MRLLFDQNLSPSLVTRLTDLFPGSSHTEVVGAAKNDDRWAKDNDFGVLAREKGSPPKAIWIRLGNCTTNDVEEAIRRDIDAIREFGETPEASLLIILPPL